MRNLWPAAIVAHALALCACFPPEWGASAILHPSRRPTTAVPTIPYRDVTFKSDGLTLHGWLFPTSAPRRGLLVYMHGITDNRGSGIGVAQRYGPRGWDVLAFDERAHGDSEGDTCTYGALERHDLSRALDAVGATSAIVFGSSLGAAIALEDAPEDARIIGVIAQSPFADLRTVVADRAPFIASKSDIDGALRIAGERGHFNVDDASPEGAAARIHVPVLLIHGANDDKTPPAHSQRIFARLAGPKQLYLVEGAGHDDALAREETWTRITQWLEQF
jgi:pimeloyl-ACP methyl ester carboxylesterase